jgi:hypothetical protein
LHRCLFDILGQRRRCQTVQAVGGGRLPTALPQRGEVIGSFSFTLTEALVADSAQSCA